MSLTGPQLDHIHLTIRAAYTREDLRRVMRVCMEEDFDELVNDKPFGAQVFDLVRWADRQGRIPELISCAVEYNPGNENLRAVWTEMQSWGPLATESLRISGMTDASIPAPPQDDSIQIFLSYSRKDLTIVRRLLVDLQLEGFSVWTDEALQPGTPVWQAAIEQAIRHCTCLIAVLSPDAKASKWVGIEIGFAERLGRKVFPVLAAGDETDAVPLSLFTTQYVDLRADYETGVNRQLLPALHKHLRLAERPNLASEADAKRLGQAADHPLSQASSPVSTPDEESATTPVDVLIGGMLASATCGDTGIATSHTPTGPTAGHREDVHPSRDEIVTPSGPAPEFAAGRERPKKPWVQISLATAAILVLIGAVLVWQAPAMDIATFAAQIESLFIGRVPATTTASQLLGQWALISTQSADSSEQVWLTSSEFPGIEIRQYWRQGYNVSSVSYGDKTWCVIAETSPDDRLQSYATTHDFPSEPIQEAWDAGYEVTSLAYGGGLWAVIATQKTYKSVQAYFTSLEFPGSIIQQYWRDGYAVTALTFGQGKWAVVVTKMDRYPPQKYETRLEFPGKQIQDTWSSGYGISTLTYGGGLWAFIATQRQEESLQKYMTSLTFPDEQMELEQNNGYATTSVAFGSYRE